MTALDAAYLPALAYLAVVCLLLWWRGRCPTWTHAAALLIAVPVRFLQEGTLIPLGPLLCAGALFVVLVAVAARTISGVSLFALVTALALLPADGWLAAAVGMAGAAVVGAVRVWRHLGRDRVELLVHETLNAIGLSPATGAVVRPDPSRLLAREHAVDVSESTALARRMRMYLPPYLLAGVLVGALLNGGLG